MSSDAAKVAHRRSHWFAEVWWSLVEGAVRAMRVVVVDVDRQDAFEMAAVEDQEPIEAFTADAGDPALHVRVGAWRAYRCSDYPDCLGPEHLVGRTLGPSLSLGADGRSD